MGDNLRAVAAPDDGGLDAALLHKGIGSGPAIFVFFDGKIAIGDNSLPCFTVIDLAWWARFSQDHPKDFT